MSEFSIQPGEGATAAVEPIHAIGDLRTSGPNALGATNDRDALRLWLQSISLKSPHTAEAYKRDAERFLMWTMDRGKTLSTITFEDAVAHVGFLLNPPERWINPAVVARTNWAWKPMRGPLSASSAQRALVAISGLYRFLLTHGYLRGNPFYGVRVPRMRDADVAQSVDTRSFSDTHLLAIRRTLEGMKASRAKRRLVATLKLAGTTGSRRHELTTRTWGDVRELALNAGMEHAAAAGVECYLAVVGKGGVRRDVPMQASTLDALRAHLAHRKALEERGLMPKLPFAETPLLNAFRSTRVTTTNGRLRDGSLYQLLKHFFKQVADASPTADNWRGAARRWVRISSAPLPTGCATPLPTRSSTRREPTSRWCKGSWATRAWPRPASMCAPTWSSAWRPLRRYRMRSGELGLPCTRVGKRTSASTKCACTKTSSDGTLWLPSGAARPTASARAVASQRAWAVPYGLGRPIARRRQSSYGLVHADSAGQQAIAAATDGRGC